MPPYIIHESSGATWMVCVLSSAHIGTCTHEEQTVMV